MENNNIDNCVMPGSIKIILHSGKTFPNKDGPILLLDKEIVSDDGNDPASWYSGIMENSFFIGGTNDINVKWDKELFQSYVESWGYIDTSKKELPPIEKLYQEWLDNRGLNNIVENLVFADNYLKLIEDINTVMQSAFEAGVEYAKKH